MYGCPWVRAAGMYHDTMEELLTCPNDPSHRIRSRRMAYHLVRCKPKNKSLTAKPKNRRTFESHVGECSSVGNVEDESKPLNNTAVLPVVGDADVLASYTSEKKEEEEEEDWNGDYPTYDPWKATENRDIIRIKIGGTKAENRAFRYAERRRHEALHAEKLRLKLQESSNLSVKNQVEQHQAFYAEKSHVGEYSSVGNVEDESKPLNNTAVLPVVGDADVLASYTSEKKEEEEEDWNGDYPTYDPWKATENRDIIRIKLGGTKAEKRAFRYAERRRHEALHAEKLRFKLQESSNLSVKNQVEQHQALHAEKLRFKLQESSNLSVKNQVEQHQAFYAEKSHVGEYSSVGNVEDESKPLNNTAVLPVVGDADVLASYTSEKKEEEEEDWNGDYPTYDPWKATENRDIIRIKLGGTKAEKRAFRYAERRRHEALHAEKLRFKLQESSNLSVKNQVEQHQAFYAEKSHVGECSSVGNVEDESKPLNNTAVLPVVGDADVLASYTSEKKEEEEEEDWNGDYPTYDPWKATENRDIIRIKLGGTKAERRAFRYAERRRHEALHAEKLRLKLQESSNLSVKNPVEQQMAVSKLVKNLESGVSGLRINNVYKFQ